MWQASSRPGRFFAALEGHPPRLLAAFGVAWTSYLSGALVLALAFVRLTGSDALLPVALAALALSLIHALFLWGVGGFLLQIPATLEARAWELAGWSWSPLVFLALLAAPLAYLAPLLGALSLLGGFLIWHLLVVQAGLQALAPGFVNRTFAAYALVLFGAPLVAVTVAIYAVGAL